MEQKFIHIIENHFSFKVLLQGLDTDLLGALQNLLCVRGSQDGSVASWTELQVHGKPSHQLDPQLCDGDFVIHHCDCLLRQD